MATVTTMAAESLPAGATSSSRRMVTLPLEGAWAVFFTNGFSTVYGISADGAAGGGWAVAATNIEGDGFGLLQPLQLLDGSISYVLSGIHEGKHELLTWHLGAGNSSYLSLRHCPQGLHWNDLQCERGFGVREDPWRESTGTARCWSAEATPNRCCGDDASCWDRSNRTKQRCCRAVARLDAILRFALPPIVFPAHLSEDVWRTLLGVAALSPPKAPGSLEEVEVESRWLNGSPWVIEDAEEWPRWQNRLAILAGPKRADVG
eukprot:gnl/TRDRNA2_/TRDRNA2_198511_c0_seq1.p1 gnl/TRDRNA2_/TRDRNA2_198511_c0~~gnl/TRDRNA2_/TRDRNA2_198511_c0_seq1.p1  ORF type:complete len:289 (-),score=27.53 gnl/TRDRNA2_/TRDRNA2_198511_c0_seq1:58-843(-)